MNEDQINTAPTQCPVCAADLRVTHLQCMACGTEVNGNFALGRLAGLREPHASMIELFLQARGNVKEMERALGLSYPTVRARLEEAFVAAGFGREADRVSDEAQRSRLRAEILNDLEAGNIGPEEAAERLRELKARRM